MHESKGDPERTHSGGACDYEGTGRLPGSIPQGQLNRFGAYFLDELRDAINIDYRLPVVSLSN